MIVTLFYWCGVLLGLRVVCYLFCRTFCLWLNDLVWVGLENVRQFYCRCYFGVL